MLELIARKQAKGDSPNCFVASVINTQARHNLTTKEIDWLAGVML